MTQDIYGRTIFEEDSSSMLEEYILESFPDPSFFKRLVGTAGLKSRCNLLLDELWTLNALELQEQPFIAKGQRVHNIIINSNEEDDCLLPHYMVSAHYDVANPLADNVNDNLASVYMLLQLIRLLDELIESGYRLPFRFTGVFTTLEEVGGLGAAFFSERSTRGFRESLDLLINLELVAQGDRWWAESGPELSHLLAYYLSVASNNPGAILNIPFSDALIYREVGQLPAVCVGRLTQDQIDPAIHFDKMPQIWHNCHQISDRYDLFDASAHRRGTIELLFLMSNPSLAARLLRGK